MTSLRLFAATCVLLAAMVSSACQKQKPKPVKAGIGHVVTGLSVGVGGTWAAGYSVHVSPEEYALVEAESCPTAKEAGPIGAKLNGLCVVRITKEQSDRFQAAMMPFKRNAIPLESFSFEDPYVRPDGRLCKKKVTDSRTISLLWSSTEGVQIATYYLGCDYEEFENFYKSLLSVTAPLPIQHIINEG